MDLQEKTEGLFGSVGQILLLGRDLLDELVHLSIPFSNLVTLFLEQVMLLGTRSLSLVVVTGVATGTVFALQLGYGLERFGGNLYIPTIVGLSILRELGPVLTGLLLAGRVGSGITAEISSMVVTEQIEAIRALGANPVGSLVVPRVTACVLVFPFLTLISDYVAILSAMLVSKQQFAVEMNFFISKLLQSAFIADMTSGLIKAGFFGLGIGFIATWKGLRASGGTRGVGIATTEVVVLSSIFILVSDVFLSKLFISIGFFSGEAVSMKGANAKCVLQVRDLKLAFGENEILRGVSFDVYEDEILGVMGSSGGGKSTVLKSIIGLIKPIPARYGLKKWI